MRAEILTNLEAGKQMDKWQLSWVESSKLEAKGLRRRGGENQANSCHSLPVRLRNWRHQTLLRQGAWEVVQVEAVNWRLFERLPDFLSSTPGRGLEDSSKGKLTDLQTLIMVVPLWNDRALPDHPRTKPISLSHLPPHPLFELEKKQLLLMRKYWDLTG